MALAIVALLFRVAAPPGTMVAETGRGAALVICTGHGPMAAMPAPGHGPASPAKTDGGCAFAADTANGLTSDVPVVLTFTPWSPAAPIALTRTSAFARGLAAPPPPSQAPPTRFI